MNENKFGMISKYMVDMQNEGIAETRIPELWDSLYDLLKAVSKLDPMNLSLFWEKTIEDRLEEMAKVEKLRDVVPYMPTLIEGDLLDEDRAIALTIHIEDIISRAKDQFDIDLSKEDAREILQDVAKAIGSNATDQGPFWDTIDSEIESQFVE